MYIVTIPAKEPTRAIKLILFAYHKNGMFSIPIATTPTAEPIINRLPPTPAQYVSKCQNNPSCTKYCI